MSELLRLLLSLLPAIPICNPLFASLWLRLPRRKLQFQGDSTQYVGEVARLTFFIIAATCDEFRRCFPDSEVFSGPG